MRVHSCKVSIEILAKSSRLSMVHGVLADKAETRPALIGQSSASRLGVCSWFVQRSARGLHACSVLATELDGPLLN